IGEMRTTLEQQLRALQEDNASKLEKMRETVDEKLQSTLTTRLDSSFKLVSERLEQVQRGLGEMQQLATGVGDLKRVLSNVKTRGGWGEVQLENILDQTLTGEQYARSVRVRPDSAERVDFAVRLPGRGADAAPLWLPSTASSRARTTSACSTRRNRATRNWYAARALSSSTRSSSRPSRYVISTWFHRISPISR